MTPGISESQREPLQQRGPFWTPITPRRGSFFHADPHFEPADGFKLLGVIGAVRNADARATIKGEFETPAGSSVTVAFEGVPSDALPLRDFMDPQLKLAAEKDVTFSFSLAYAEGLATSGDMPTKLVEQLTRFATGAAYVEATAEPKP